MNYTEYKAWLLNMAVADDNAVFENILPNVILYAENRMARDLDFLSTVTPNTSLSFTPNQRYLTIPESLFVTTQEFNVITPAGTTNPELGFRAPLMPTSKEFLDYTYGSSIGAGIPKYFAPLNNTRFLFGPWPDDDYTVEIIGTIRAVTLSAANPVTFISTYMTDLFQMASLIYIAGYQRNFGKMSDDPAQAMSYEQQYQLLLKPAMTEEARKKYQAAAWTSMSPAVAATPTRG